VYLRCKEQRRIFYEETKCTLDAYNTEQNIRLEGRLPTMEEYWSYRHGSSCCLMVGAMLEYSLVSFPRIPAGKTEADSNQVRKQNPLP